MSESLKSLLLQLNKDVLRAPLDAEASSTSEAYLAAEAYVAAGGIPLPYHLPRGERAVCWYHGPLIACKLERPSLSLPARAADELLIYDKTLGVFDASYATAWELGRRLLLQSPETSVAFSDWTRGHAALARNLRNRLGHLSLAGMNEEHAPEMPEGIRTWFEDLRKLEFVPFENLVPDERMLPRNSLRFFWLDPAWIECLLDGAFGVGCDSKYDRERDPDQSVTVPEEPHTTMTGVLVHREGIASWPGLQVDAYEGHQADPALELRVVRSEALSANVLLCLFAGEAHSVDIHQAPGGLHIPVP